MQMSPYLSLNGQCEAAFTFYEQVLGGAPGPWLVNCEGPPT